MKIFNRNEEDTIGYKIGHKLLGDLWDYKKERSLVLLLLWGMFITFVIVFIRTSNNVVVKESIYTDPSILISNLNNYNYDLTLHDNLNNKYIYYNGYIDNGIDIGTKKENDTIINYRIVDGITYDNSTNELLLYPYDELSLNIIYYLNNYIKSYEENDLMVYVYEVNYNTNIINVYLRTNKDNIKSISYEYNNISYIINYY